MLAAAGVTMTVGVSSAVITVTVEVPDALLYDAVLAESGVYFAVNVLAPVASDPAVMVIDADPKLSVVVAEV